MLEVHSLGDSARLGSALARALRAPTRRVRVHRFPDGESLPRVRPAGAPHAVVVRSLHDPDPKLMELLLTADALRRAGARRVTLVAPYLAYMRQDRVFRAGEPVSQRVLAGVLGDAFDRVLTLEAHLHRIARLQEVFACPARSLGAAPLVARWLAGRPGRPLLVGPDEESGPWVRRIARAARLPSVVGRKHRLSDARVRVELGRVPAGDHAVIVDDIASSGATLAATARALRAAGVRRVEAVVVHAVFAPGAEARLRRAGVARVVSTDTIPHPTNGIRAAAAFARALARPRPQPRIR